MKISLNWLGLFVDLSSVHAKYTPRDIAHEYSIHTAEIEGIQITERCDGVVLGKVLTAERHPDSTKLWICHVDVGGGVVEQILTGAPNVYAGMYTPVALVGCQLAPDFTIGERKMAGMISRGMMCGADEIGLASTSSGGIMDLNASFETKYLESNKGTSIFDLMVPILGPTGEAEKIPLMDIVLEIDNKNITNRPDLFGIYGHAREFATVFDVPKISLDTSTCTDIAGSKNIKLEIQTDRVFSYSLAQVEGIVTTSSPLSVQLLLERSGHSSHGAIVDMTNYLMMELGQPMHAFDADTIVGHIVVRQAKVGESIVALDGKTYELSEEDIVIADTEKVLAIAGVMGGLTTGITDSTKNICIESAVFDPTSIRLTAQRLGLRSDASTRFEKSLDPTFSPVVLRRAIQFLKFAKAGGMVTGHFEYLSESKVHHTEIKLTHAFIENRLGKKIAETEVLKTLSDLEFSPIAQGGVYEVIVPSHRATKDVRIVEDIVEEVGRIHGYDTISEAPIPGKFEITHRNDSVAMRNKIQNYFAMADFYETFNYSFSNAKKDEAVLIFEEQDAIHIQNAVSQDFTMMRRSMAPLLFLHVHENLKQKSRVNFFEIAKVHHKNDGVMYETKKFAGVMTHGDAITVRKLIDGLLIELGASAKVLQGGNLPFLHPNSSGEYANGNTILGSFGSLHPKVLQNFELPATTWYFEMDIPAIYAAISEHSKYIEPSKYPSISRELNFLLQKTANTGEIAYLIASVDTRIHSLAIVDVYENEKIGVDMKSVTFSFIIEDYTKTITDGEALEIQNAIITSLAQKSIYLRG